MSKKDPAFLFYSSDFLTGTMFFSNEQTGIYIRLLCSQHQHGGMIDKIVFNSLVKDDAVLKSKFIETDIGFYNERLAKEMELRCKKSTNISIAVKEVWNKRRNKDGIPLESQNDSKEILMGTEDEDENEDKVKNNKDEKIKFEVFWDSYNKKVGAKDKCKKKWEHLSKTEQLKIIETLPKFLSQYSDKQYQPFPETYLNQKRWNDEIINNETKPKSKAPDYEAFRNGD
jgi:uncharacterized protein YdaU (DUF1376 family)